MTLKEIYNGVRWCIDEESGSQDYEDTYLDNLIKSKIEFSLRWCALNANIDYLTSENESGTGDLITDYSVQQTQAGSVITLPRNILRLVRVRCSGWNKAVSNFIEEDSDEYLMQSDETSKATCDRPVVAIIRKSPRQIELFPSYNAGDTVEYSIVVSPSVGDLSNASDEITVNVPEKMVGGFLYYIAFLVMSARNDNKAATMLAIARQSLGLDTTTTT